MWHMACYMAGIFALAVLGYHLFEQPVRSWHPASHRTALCVMLPGVGLAMFWLFLLRGPLAQAQGPLDPEPHTPSNH